MFHVERAARIPLRERIQVLSRRLYPRVSPELREDLEQGAMVELLERHAAGKLRCEPEQTSWAYLELVLREAARLEGRSFGRFYQAQRAAEHVELVGEREPDAVERIEAAEVARANGDLVDRLRAIHDQGGGWTHAFEYALRRALDDRDPPTDQTTEQLLVQWIADHAGELFQQTELAHRFGLARETINRRLRRLQERGQVRIEVVNGSGQNVGTRAWLLG